MKEYILNSSEDVLLMQKDLHSNGSKCAYAATELAQNAVDHAEGGRIVITDTQIKVYSKGSSFPTIKKVLADIDYSNEKEGYRPDTNGRHIGLKSLIASGWILGVNAFQGGCVIVAERSDML